VRASTTWSFFQPATDEKALTLAVGAVRRNHTAYDELLARGVDRADARQQIADKVEECWEIAQLKNAVARVHCRSHRNLRLTPSGICGRRITIMESIKYFGNFSIRTRNGFRLRRFCVQRFHITCLL